MTVNQRVAGSSPAGGASMDKAAEMSPFSFSSKEFGGCNFLDCFLKRVVLENEIHYK